MTRPAGQCVTVAAAAYQVCFGEKHLVKRDDVRVPQPHVVCNLREENCRGREHEQEWLPGRHAHTHVLQDPTSGRLALCALFQVLVLCVCVHSVCSINRHLEPQLAASRVLTSLSTYFVMCCTRAERQEWGQVHAQPRLSGSTCLVAYAVHAAHRKLRNPASLPHMLSRARGSDSSGCAKESTYLRPPLNELERNLRAQTEGLSDRISAGRHSLGSRLVKCTTAKPWGRQLALGVGYGNKSAGHEMLKSTGGHRRARPTQAMVSAAPPPPLPHHELESQSRTLLDSDTESAGRAQKAVGYTSTAAARMLTPSSPQVVTTSSLDM